MERGNIFVIYGTEIFENTLKLLEAAELAEMIGDRKRSVAVKPNLVTAKPAQSGATTHPEIVAGVLEYLRREGFENVAVMEGSWVGDRTDEAYRVSGIGAVCEKYGVPYYDLQRDSAREYDARGMRLRICDRGFYHQPARAEGPLPDARHLCAEEYEGFSARQRKAAFSRAGADEAHRASERRHPAGFYSC